MHKSKTIQKAKNQKGETVYIAVKTRTGFDSDIVKCVILVKTSKKIHFQSRTVILDSWRYELELERAQIFFDDATSKEPNLKQLPLF